MEPSSAQEQGDRDHGACELDVAPQGDEEPQRKPNERDPPGEKRVVNTWLFSCQFRRIEIVHFVHADAGFSAANLQ